MTQAFDDSVAWLRRGWEMFSAHPSTWTVLTGSWFLTALLLVFVPMGGLLWWLIGPAVYAGFLHAAAEIEQGRPAQVTHLFEGFKDAEKRWAFVTLGALTMLGYLIMSMVLSSLTDHQATSTVQIGNAVVSKGIPWAFIISVVLRLVLTLMITMLLTSALMFSAPLVMFRHFEGIEAMMTSAEVVWENWRSLALLTAVYAFVAALGFLIFFLPNVNLVLFILGTVLVGVGVLVLAPVTICSTYASYKSLFAES